MGSGENWQVTSAGPGDGLDTSGEGTARVKDETRRSMPRGQWCPLVSLGKELLMPALCADWHGKLGQDAGSWTRPEIHTGLCLTPGQSWANHSTSRACFLSLTMKLWATAVFSHEATGGSNERVRTGAHSAACHCKAERGSPMSLWEQQLE